MKMTEKNIHYFSIVFASIITILCVLLYSGIPDLVGFISDLLMNLFFSFLGLLIACLVYEFFIIFGKKITESKMMAIVSLLLQIVALVLFIIALFEFVIPYSKSL